VTYLGPCEYDGCGRWRCDDCGQSYHRGSAQAHESAHHCERTSPMKPTVGRIVHYTNLGDRDGKYPPEVQAAIITKVKPGAVVDDDDAPQDVNENDCAVSLRIFYEMGDFSMVAVPFTSEAAGSEAARGKWTWPQRA